MVHAIETSLRELLEGTKQYLVPLYQRTYSWGTAQHGRLWDDVLKLAEDRGVVAGQTHFIGSLVLAPSPTMGPTGVQQYLVVDGQQRLTTLSLLLCAIRDHRTETEDPHHRDRVNEQYLLNKWKQGDLRPKLLPTQADRAAYLACLDSAPQAGGANAIGAAYRFFRTKLVEADDLDDPHDIERVEEAVISGLGLVAVTAQPGDNAHRIFESLNNTGLKLTQGDLLRNYLFMRLPTRGTSVYPSIWLPLQEGLSSDELETLFWLDVVRDDPRIKQTDTYAAQQARLDRLVTEEEVEADVVRVARLGHLFRRILHPELEADPRIRRGLARLQAWGATTVYPLLLHLLDLSDREPAQAGSAARAMTYIEAFLVRRLLTGRATNNLNRILLSAVTEMERNGDVAEAVRAYFSAGRKYYSTDDEIRQAISMQPFYWNGRPHQRALVLGWLEESYGSREPVSGGMLTIEHVMPQTLTPAWESDLGQDLPDGETVDAVHARWLHTLANLTLTGYNPTLSNHPFAVKRAKLATSGLSMNREIAAHERWGAREMEQRAAALADRIIGLWPGPAGRVVPGDGGSPLWTVMDQALAALPAGTWTTYGDLAMLIGSHARPVGNRLSSAAVPNAHRVLQSNGTPSAAFHWLDPAQTDDPLDVLRQEGVDVDEHGQADAAQRLTAQDLAELIGRSTDALLAVPDPDDGGDGERRDRFVEQLSQAQPPEVVTGVLRLLDGWTSSGGRLEYGRAHETSCFLMAERGGFDGPAMWPLVVYPSGAVEVVFQHLAVRPPFDDLALREELRVRLEDVPGVRIAKAKLQLRPSFPLEVLADEAGRLQVMDVLRWFLAAVESFRASEDPLR